MGLLSWLFPSPEDRLAKAQKLLDEGLFADARHEATGLDLPGATEIVHKCEIGLTRSNLDAAVSWAEADDPDRVEIHMELARQYRQPGMEDEFALARAAIQQVTTDRATVARAEVEAEDKRLAEIAPGFADARETPDIPLPDGTPPEEAEELKARLALILDNYPQHLRAGMVELGPTFAQAVLDLEEGRAKEALPSLLSMPDTSPLVQHERARAAHALGDPGAAARAWTAFAKHADGHHPIGANHTAVLLAGVQAESSDLKGAISTLREGRKTEPDLGGALYAQLLEATGQLEEAEHVLRGLIIKHGSEPTLFVLLARVRAAGGHRMAAMQALETGLEKNDCPPGRCGFRPPHLGLHRDLAILYLEDGIEQERALELATKAHDLVQQPTWDDLYLAALVEKTRASEQFDAMAKQLWQATPDTHPRRSRLETYLPLTA